MNKRINLLSLAFFSALTLIFISSCSNKQESARSSEIQAIRDFPVLTLKLRNTVLNNKYPATIEGQQNIEIRPKIDGYVEEIFVNEGATVTVGQALFTISAPQYEQEVRTAKANIKIAEADVNTAQMEVNKVKPLVQKGIISRYELESAEFNLQSRQAALAQAEATLVNAQTNYGYTKVTSPVNGVVGTIPYKIGSLVSSTTALPLTTVSNIGNIYAYFSINEKQILEFVKNSEGKSMDQIMKSFPEASLMLANGALFSQKGKIEAASGLINSATGSISVRATFPNPGNVIRSGSSGSVVIPLEFNASIIIPQKATFEIQGQKFVYVVKEDGKIQDQPIQVLANNDGRFYVVEEGLQEGDRIVLEGLGLLREGIEIKPVEVEETEVYGNEDAQDTKS